MEGYKSDLFGIEGLRDVNEKKTDKEILIIDTASGYGLGSQKILGEAELTVVVFPPERECVDAFFSIGNGITGKQFLYFRKLSDSAVLQTVLLDQTVSHSEGTYRNNTPECGI